MPEDSDSEKFHDFGVEYYTVDARFDQASAARGERRYKRRTPRRTAAFGNCNGDETGAQLPPEPVSVPPGQRT